MNKWEKVFYKEQFCEVHMKLEENLRQQNEIYEKIAEMLGGIEARMDKTDKLLKKVLLNVKEVKKSTEQKVDAAYESLQEQTEEAFRENQENLKEVVSLVKMLLVNSLLEDMEDMEEMD